MGHKFEEYILSRVDVGPHRTCLVEPLPELLHGFDVEWEASIFNICPMWCLLCTFDNSYYIISNKHCYDLQGFYMEMYKQNIQHGC